MAVLAWYQTWTPETYLFDDIYSECKPHNVITVNIISRLLWSHVIGPICHTLIRLPYKATGYCYHSVIVISFSWFQSKQIKRLPLFMMRLGAIQIIPDTFSALFRPPLPPMWHVLSTFTSKIANKNCHVTFLPTPPPP